MKKQLRCITIFLLLAALAGSVSILVPRLFPARRAALCSACRPGGDARLYLLCTDTGERYALDLPKKVPSYLKGTSATLFTENRDGSASAAIMNLPGAGRETVTIKYSGANSGAARLHKLFCADCAADILRAIRKSPLKSYVLFDRASSVCYPITERSLTIGNHLFAITAQEGGYRIEITRAHFSSST